MNVLIIGSGGREHAMAWKVAQSPRLTKLYIAPGNAGTGDCGENVLLDVTSHAEVVRFCREKQIDLVLIGPEIPLGRWVGRFIISGANPLFWAESGCGADRSVEVICKGFHGAASYSNGALCHVR